jgi:hypothetical protein
MAATTRIISDTFYGGLEVASFTVTAGGSAYTSAPTVAVAAPPSGGGQATATATIAGGVVTAVTITNPGNSYILAPIVSFSGGGGTLAAATAVMSTGEVSNYTGETCVLIDFSNHGAAVTIDASAQLGGSNGTQGFQKYRIDDIRWSTDKYITVAFTGTGTSGAICVAPGQGHFGVPLANLATQPGDATNADITVTPAASCYGFMMLKLAKEAFV